MTPDLNMSNIKHLQAELIAVNFKINRLQQQNAPLLS